MAIPPEQVIKIINLKKFADNYRDLQEILPQFIDKFLADAPKYVKEIQAALGEKNAATVGKRSHALKGMLAQVFATSSVELALSLEKAGASGSLEQVPELLNKLQVELERLYEVLRSVKDMGF